AAAHTSLSETVKKIIDHDKHIRIYQRIASPPSIDNVGDLMSYVLGVPPPPDFKKNYHLYQDALTYARWQPIVPANVQPQVEKILQESGHAAIQDEYSRSQLLPAVAKLASLAGALTAPASPGTLANIRIKLDPISDLLRGYGWPAGTPADASV